MTDTTETVIRAVLESSPRIAMVGASPRPGRPSHGVLAFLLERGYDVYPVNPTALDAPIHGRTVHASLAAVPAPFEMVDIFRRAEDAGAVVDEAIALAHEKGIRAIWMQLGVIDRNAAERARAAGLAVVMDHCPAIEIPRLYGNRSPLGGGKGPIAGGTAK